MNPYEILGVSPNATNAEIKSAYRKLVKKFHPDVNKGQHEGIIKQLNEAYDILFDPARKAEYDNGITAFTFEYEEDPREVYRREYIAKKKEKDRKEKEEKNRKLAKFEAGMKIVYRVVWLITIPTTVFALLLVVDGYLPQDEYNESAELGWQKRINKTRHHRRHFHWPEDLVSYMKTKHFIIAVPDDIHIDYDYYATTKEILTISVSPIFKIPSTVSLRQNGARVTADIERTIFSNPFKLHYLLLLSSLFIALRRNYSELNFCLCFLSPVFLLCVWFIMR